MCYTPEVKGFTLTEVLVTTALMGILLGMTIVTMNRNPPGNVRAAAERMAEELKLARNKAVSTGEPVGLVIPDGNDSPGFYILEGRVNPSRTEQTVITADHKGVHLNPVHWSGPSLEASAGLALSMELEGFTWPTWNPPTPEDYIIVFLPSGAALNNKLAFDGHYHFLVSRGATSSPSNVSGVDSRALSAINDAYTVSVSPAGHISTSKGVLGATSVNEEESLAYGSALMAAGSNPANSNPSDLQIEIFPKPNANATVLGVDATVDEDGFLTLKATAVDDQSDQLRCFWSCIESEGSFSFDEEMEMEWNGDSGRWEAVWEWYPPKPDLVGEYTLDCTVTDGRGGSVSSLIPVNGKVMVLHQGKIAYASNDTGDFDIYTCNPDGTDVTNLTPLPGSTQRFPSWTPDGRKLVYTSDESGLLQLHSINSDGTNSQQITFSPTAKYHARISPDGTRLIWVTYIVGSQRIYTSDFDGQNETMVFETAGVSNTTGNPCFSLDNQTIFFQGGQSGLPEADKYDDPVSELWKINVDGTGLKQLTSHPTRVIREPEVSRADGRLIYFSFRGGPSMVYTGEYDSVTETLNEVEIPVDLSWVESPRWSATQPNEVVCQQYRGPTTRDLWIMNISTGQSVRKLMDNPGGAMMDHACWGAVTTAP